MTSKVVHIRSYYKPTGKEVMVDVPTGEIEQGAFGREKKIMKKEMRFKPDGGFSDVSIDGERLSEDIAKAAEQLDAEGYEVVSVVPITSGAYRSQAGLGYGYSITSGVTLVAKK